MDPYGKEDIDKWHKLFLEDPSNMLNMSSTFERDIADTCTNYFAIEQNCVFIQKIEPQGAPISNQENTGRCWIFASLNAMRIPFIKKYDLLEFEFSKAHIYFWDKMDKAYKFLSNIVTCLIREEPLEGRLVQFLLNDPVNDGGQWDMLVDIVQRYGVMPKQCYQESFSSNNSENFNQFLTQSLKKYACDILNLWNLEKTSMDNVKELISQQMSSIYKIISISIGIPPATFTWEYYDQKNVYHKIGPITSVDFYREYVQPIFDVQNKICLINDPRPSNTFGKCYTVDLLGNVSGRRPIIYYNQPIEVLMEAATQSVKKGEAVWFGCDVGQRLIEQAGVLQLNGFMFKEVLGSDIGLTLSKANRLLFAASGMNHAMVLTAVSINADGKPQKWEVENSWGKGNLVMTDDWFREFVYEVVVDKCYITKEVLDAGSGNPIVLPTWDPMGTLACSHCAKRCGRK